MIKAGLSFFSSVVCVVFSQICLTPWIRADFTFALTEFGGGSSWSVASSPALSSSIPQRLSAPLSPNGLLLFARTIVLLIALNVDFRVCHGLSGQR